VLIEECIDIFNTFCLNSKGNQISLILEMVFNLYIPITQFIKPKEGEHSSLYKRITMSLYGYNIKTLIEKMQ
jgi:hypothetical protein